MLRLSGRIRSGDLKEIRDQMDGPRDRFGLDLKEVALVDSEAVRFLGSCEIEGVELVNCAHYIRDWISREQSRPGPGAHT